MVLRWCSLFIRSVKTFAIQRVRNTGKALQGLPFLFLILLFPPLTYIFHQLKVVLSWCTRDYAHQLAIRIEHLKKEQELLSGWFVDCTLSRQGLDTAIALSELKFAIAQSIHERFTTLNKPRILMADKAFISINGETHEFRNGVAQKDVDDLIARETSYFFSNYGSIKLSLHEDQVEDPSQFGPSGSRGAK